MAQRVKRVPAGARGAKRPNPLLGEVSFTCTRSDFQLIEKIVNRALALCAQLGGDPCQRQDLMMDVIAVHVNGTPLRLRELLWADDASFGHDVFGIRRFLNRDDATLTQCFTPRFAVPENWR